MSAAVNTLPAADLVEFRGMLDRFGALVLDWELSPHETAALLRLPSASWERIRLQVIPVPADAEMRMRRAVDVDQSIRTLLGDLADCRIWLRRPNPGIIGHRRPLQVMCDGDVGLRRLRDALREEVALSGPGAAW